MNIEKELLEYLYVKLPTIIKVELTPGVRGKLLPGKYLYQNWGQESRGNAEWLSRVARWESTSTMLWINFQYGEFLEPTKLMVCGPRCGSWSRKGSDCWIPVFFSAISQDLRVYLSKVSERGSTYLTDGDTSGTLYPDRSKAAISTFKKVYGQVDPDSLGSCLATHSGRISSAVENKVNTPKQEDNTMQKLMNEMVAANKEALSVAAKLSVGKTANSTLLATLASKLPWYSRLFGGKKDLMENPLARIASAQLAVALSKHFAPRNEKLAYVADAMLQESMVELITNGEQLQSLITQLEALAGNVTGEIKS